MVYRSLIGAIALIDVPCVTIVDVQALDDAKYPDLKGQWIRAEGARGGLSPLADAGDLPHGPREGRHSST